MKYWVLLICFFLSSSALAQMSSFEVQNTVAKLYQEKKYADVVKFYEAHKAAVLEKENTTLLVNISYEKLRQYPQALAMNFDYIKKNHATETAKLMTAIQNKETVKSDDYSKGMKSSFFRVYGDYSQKILAYSSQADIKPADTVAFDRYKKALEVLEFQEGTVDKLNDQVAGHLKLLEQKTYHWRKRVFIDYLSWQTSAALVGPYETTALLSTNVGFCPGVGLSYESNFWAFSLDLSFLYGSGGVSATQGAVTYQQSDVSAVGGKASLGAGMIVSSTRSELGLRATFLYVTQSLAVPDSAGYSIDQPNNLSEVISIYSRWSFDRFYFQTDFGRYVKRPATLWSLGIGYSL